MVELLAELIKEGAYVNEKDHFGRTPLDRARNEEVKAALREHGAKHSLFHAAFSEGGMVELVAELIKEGADVNEKNQFGKTPLDWARNEEVKAALREHGAKHSLFHAAEEGILELVAELIKEGADANEKDYFGDNPLAYATNEAKAVFAGH